MCISGGLEDDREDSTAPHMTFRPRISGHRQCGLAICTFHLGFSLVGLGVPRINRDGPAVVLNGQAGLVQIGVGAAPAVVGVAVVRGQLDKMVEIQNGLFELLALDARKGPGGPGAGVAGFEFQEGSEVFDGLVVCSQGDVGQPLGDQGDRVVELEGQGRSRSPMASS